jgi:hypothetical protein
MFTTALRFPQSGKGLVVRREFRQAIIRRTDRAPCSKTPKGGPVSATALPVEERSYATSLRMCSASTSLIRVW